MFDHLENLLNDFETSHKDYDSDDCSQLTATTYSSPSGSGLDQSDSSSYSDSDDSHDGEDEEAEVNLSKPRRGLFLSPSMQSFLQKNQGVDFQKMDLFETGSTTSVGLIIEANPKGPQEKKKEEDVKLRTNPMDLLKSLLAAHGETAATTSYEQLQGEGYFLALTDEMIKAYDANLMSAVRRGDVDIVRQMHAKNQTLQCSNKFGETIMHTCARRGHYQMLHFLVHEAQLSLRVCCDSGRTPLHDACWTGSPNFDCIQLILEQCPQYLLVADKRNFVPLEYAAKSSWPAWCEFLTNNVHLFTKPKVFIF